MSDKNRVYIFDTTMRDGEQSPGASMSLEEKIQIARVFDDLGVDIIEAGFPIASPGDFEAVSEVSKILKKSIPAGLSRHSVKDIDRAYDMLATSELAYIDKRGDKAYIGISMYDANSGEDLVTEFELTKVNNYWQVTSWSNFKELINEVIDDVIESFNNIGEEINDNLFDTKELEKELEELEKELEDLLNSYDY